MSEATTPDRPDFDAAWRQLLATEEPQADHLSADDLAAYHAGELSRSEMDRCRRHLAGCPECAALLLEADRLVPEELDDDSDNLATTAAWKRFQNRLSNEVTLAAPAKPLAVLEPEPRSVQTTWSRGWPLAAAALLVLSLGLGFDGLRLRSQLRQAQLPQADVPVVYLDTHARAGGPDATLEQTAEGPGMTLLMVSPEPTANAEGYELEILDDAGRIVVRFGSLSLNEYGTLRLLVPARSLPSGQLRVEVRASTPSGPLEAGRYSLEIRGPRDRPADPAGDGPR